MTGADQPAATAKRDRTARVARLRRTPHRAPLALLVITAALTLAGVVGESTVRLLGHQPLQLNAERAMFWRRDDRLGWHHRPGHRGVFAGREVRINAKGLRGPDHPHRRTPGRRRVLVLGDSQAWGFGVGEEEVLAARLATTMGVEVVNGGVSGFSTDQELLWLRDEGVRYRPDLVVLVVTGNDDWCNERDRVYWVYTKPRFRLTGNGLALENPRVALPGLAMRLRHWGRTHSALFFRAELLAERRAPGRLARAAAAAPGEPPPAPFALTLALVDEIRRTALASGARLLVVTSAMDWQVPRGFPDLAYPDLVEMLRRRELLVVDIDGDPAYVAGEMSFPDGHWNPRGHRFVAARIAAACERYRAPSLAMARSPSGKRAGHDGKRGRRRTPKDALREMKRVRPETVLSGPATAPPSRALASSRPA